MKKLLILCILTTLTACTVSSSSQTTPAQVSSAPTGVATGFTADINAFRASQGRGQLQPNAALTRAAQAHAEDMARRGYFSHTSVGGPNGDNFQARARSAGCAMRTGAENIATGQRSEAGVFETWENSAGHRRNMLGRSYTQYGLGRSGNIWVLKLSAQC
ncbi:Cysteine-rich secretory protein family protein [Yoonia maricola]|uniref:Cysteine-rich secretory protein family protein n=1 Tax=Yoonia maricola TaxID=420999 RepID=A0A2M8W232_9RHOB|nr:CAP domain-containing protein [Yoonia maricola]PJI84992.1 Cysteine-rich secretory protein family protein [Yoonia maricola]